jgi:hypothetical protein
MTKISIDVDMAELVSELALNMDLGDLLDMVKQIDREVGQHDFTEELRDYFVKEVEAEDLFMDD